MPTCRGIRLDGAPCGQWAIRGTEYCYLHGPDVSSRRPPNCAICRHPRRAGIEGAVAGGVRPAEISRSFRVSAALVRYHRDRHMPPAGAEGAGGDKRGQPRATGG